jgi:hypothetical protein
MPTLTQAPTEGDVLKFDLDKDYTREAVTLLAGTAYTVGAVLGRITANGKYTLSPATGSDGSQTAVAVLIEAVDATAGDRTGVVVTRGPAIVSRGSLTYHASVDDAAKRQAKWGQLAAVGIVARENA